MGDVTIRMEGPDGTKYTAVCKDPTIGEMEKWQEAGLDDVSPSDVLISCDPFESVKDVPMSLGNAILLEWQNRIMGAGKNFKVIPNR